jgi:2-polyprenyl-6-hydroxyphenyl methylase/3-demethylubiquinone-9 3-methyltransferase
MRNDLTIYEEHASEWWAPRSRWFRSLRSVNRFRLELIDEWLGPTLRNATVVDLGCGGGFLAEPLAQRGARVVGCDVSARSLAVARDHAALARLNGAWRLPSYLRADVRQPPLRDRCADLVLLADVLEHLAKPSRALYAAARLLRPGGHVYVNTIARTLRARLLAVTLAEGLGIVPRGTHDPKLFIDLDELVTWGRECGLELVHVTGESIRLARTLATWTVHLRRGRSDRMFYSALLQRRP